MRIFLAAVLLIFSAATAAAQKVVGNAVPSAAIEIPAAPGSLVTLTGAHETKWNLASESTPLGFWPDGPECRIAATSGRWLVIATTPTEVKRYVVVYGGSPPAPMPPVPVPPGPAPSDQLKQKMEATFAANTSATKKADALALASVYTAGAAAVKRPAITTAAELIDAMRASEPNGSKDKLTECRKVVAAELVAILTDLKKPLTDVSRAATAGLFTRAATILESLGN